MPAFESARFSGSSASAPPARPQWLRNAHAALDCAVWCAYGWDDSDPATVDEDIILSRLLALNLERKERTRRSVLPR